MTIIDGKLYFVNEKDCTLRNAHTKEIEFQFSDIEEMYNFLRLTSNLARNIHAS